MDGRRNFSEDQEPNWFAGERGFAEPEWRGRGEDRYPGEPRGGPAGDGRYQAGGERFPDNRFGAERYGESAPRRDPDVGPGNGGSGPVDPARVAGHPGAPPVNQGPPPVGGDAPAPGPGRPVMAATPIADEMRAMKMPTDAVPTVGPRSPDGGPASADTSRFPTESIDRATLQRPQTQGESVGDGVYRTRRPLVAVIFALLTVIFEVFAVRVLVGAALDTPATPSSVVAGTFLTLGLPIFAAGLYGVMFGRPASADPGRLWTRPPAAYLVVGLVLFLAASLAVA